MLLIIEKLDGGYHAGIIKTGESYSTVSLDALLEYIREKFQPEKVIEHACERNEGEASS